MTWSTLDVLAIRFGQTAFLPMPTGEATPSRDDDSTRVLHVPACSYSQRRKVKEENRGSRLAGNQDKSKISARSRIRYQPVLDERSMLPLRPSRSAESFGASGGAGRRANAGLALDTRRIWLFSLTF